LKLLGRDLKFEETPEYQKTGLVDIECPECSGTMKFPLWFDKGVFGCPKCGVLLAYVRTQTGLRLISTGIYETSVV